MEKELKIKQLENSIKNYDESYRLGNSIISDEKYDLIIDELKKIDPNNELLKKGIIKNNLIFKDKLPVKMNSLDKFQTYLEFYKWGGKYNLLEEEMILTPKLDGISLLTEEISNKAWTKGNDGEMGQRVDEFYKYIFKNLIENYSLLKNSFSVGELIMLEEDWNIVKELIPEYKSARNAVAGLFNSFKNFPKKILPYVTYIRYGYKSFYNSWNKELQLIHLNQNQLVQIPFIKLKFKDLTEEKINELFNEWKKQFNIDGIVVEVNDIKLQKELDLESNENPKFQKALKLGWEEVVETEILDIYFQVSKDGRLKPVAKIKPVNLMGAEITNPTLYNVKWILDKGITIGSKIKIKRSGDVIPKIVEVLNPIKIDYSNISKLYDNLMRDLKIENKSELLFSIDWDENKTDLILKVKHPLWEIAKLTYFFETIKLEEFGEPSIKSLYYAGFQNLYNILTITKEEIIKIEGFGEISANYLIKEFKKLEEEGVAFYKFADALNCFKGLGEKLLSKIDISYFNTENIEEKKKDLLKIDGFSEIRMNNFVKGLNLFSFYLKSLPIKIKQKEKIIITDKYKDLNIVFTGFRDEELEKQIKLGGGIISSGISKKVTHLVCKELNSGSGKELKALELGIKIIKFDDFIKSL